jgi:hypothetical protein
LHTLTIFQAIRSSTNKAAHTLAQARSEDCRYRTSALAGIIFTRQGLYVIQVRNNYNLRSGSVALTLIPPALKVVTDVTWTLGNGEKILSGTLGPRQALVDSLENITGGITL